MILLQRAANGAHTTAQRIEETQLVLALMFTIAGVVAASTGVAREVVIIIGAAWSLMSICVLTTQASRRSRDGAVLQEQFDTALFRLGWNDILVGDKVPYPRAIEYANKTMPGSEADNRITDGWYDPVHGVQHPYDALICQDQNLVWDSRLRRRYAAGVLMLGVTWLLGGVAVGLCVDAKVLTALVAFVVPSLGALQIGISTVRAQRDIADDRDRLSRKVAKLLDDGKPGPISSPDYHQLVKTCREIQNGIFNTRGRAGRVPGMVYKRSRDRDERELGQVAESYRKRLSGEI